MRDELDSQKPPPSRSEAPDANAAQGDTAWPLPGMIFIGIYMLVLAATISFGVIGKHLPGFLLVLVPAFVAASFGLLRMYRWAWAMALSAVFLMMSWYFWLFATTKESMGVVMGILNLTLFFYLVRVDVRRRLR